MTNSFPEVAHREILCGFGIMRFCCWAFKPCFIEYIEEAHALPNCLFLRDISVVTEIIHLSILEGLQAKKLNCNGMLMISDHTRCETRMHRLHDNGITKISALFTTSHHSCGGAAIFRGLYDGSSQ